MPHPRRRAALMASLALSMALASPASPGPPTDAYLAFRTALSKAAGPRDVATHLGHYRRDLLDVATEEELADWFADFKRTRAQVDVKVLGETPADGGVRLAAEGRDAATGDPRRGRIDMVAEAGGWKVKDELWYAPIVPARGGDAAKGDSARGTFTVDGKEARIRHVTARLVPYPFDAELPAVRLVFSDKPLPAGGGDAWERAKRGELHYFELEVGPSMNVVSGMMYHEGYGGSGHLSMAGMHRLEAKRFGPTVIEGRAYMDEKASGTTRYAVDFRVTVIEE